MPEATDTAASEAPPERSHRGLRVIITLLALLFVPAGIYALYVVGQLADIREHNLRGLDNAARAVEDLLANARTNVGHLGADPEYACTFFERQTRLALVPPDCKGLTRNIADERLTIDQDSLALVVSAGTVDIVGQLVRSPLKSASPEEVTPEVVSEIRIRVVLGALLEQIPFGAAFDQLLIVDEKGELLGAAVSPQQTSPMLPPRATVKSINPPVRTLNLSQLKFAGSTKDAPIKFTEYGDSTFVHSVELAGKRYTLMCQPWRVALDAANGDVRTWRLCGLVDSQQSFEQALEVAPHIVVLLLVLLTLAVISWPILKVLSLAPRERIRFADMYLTLLATLALTMLLAAGVADLGTYRELRERSRERLQQLALEVESHLRAELGAMHAQLSSYDAALPEETLEAVRGEKFELQNAIRISCLRLTPTERHQNGCKDENPTAGLTLPVPDAYKHFELAFWMRPEDGRQAIKGTVQHRNTPAVALVSRDYFRQVRAGRTWSMSSPRIDEFYVETSASVTTGDFFAALSMPSKLTSVGDDKARFVAALTGRLVSVRYPVLAPGVGFAIADRNGHVVFHSDERRAAVEELFADDGIADRLRAAFAANSDAEFYAHYQTRPHQIHVHPMADLPWAIMTFADDEVLRTLHVELLARTAVLVTIYLVLAFLGTLLYMLFHGREPPVWVWPRRERRYRDVYAVTVWSLAAQLVLFLLALDLLRGEFLVLASLLLPLPTLATIVIADRAAQRLSRPPSPGTPDGLHASMVERRQLRRSLAAVMATAVVLGSSWIAMHVWDRAAVARPWAGFGSFLVGLLAVIVAAAPLARTARARAVLAALRSRTLNLAWMRWWWEPLTPHIVGTTIVWLLLGALPAYALFKYALSSQMTIVTKQEQSYLARAFAWRGCAVEDDLRFIATPDVEGDRVGRVGRELLSPCHPYSDIYPEARLARPANGLGGATVVDEPGYAARFWTYLANIAPVYNETTTHSRYLGPFVDPGAGRWSWQVPVDSDSGVIRSAGLVYEHERAGGCDDFVPAIASRLPLNEPHFGWLGWIAALAFLALVTAWASFGARKLFFGDIEEDARRADGGDDPLAVLPLDRHLGRLGQPPDLKWARAEVAPIFDETLYFSERTLKEWCDQCTTRRAVVDRILEKVRQFYDSEWSHCSDEEKLLLIQLVEEGYANPKQTEIVRSLLKKGLLRRDPVLRPMNHSFAVFVEAHAEPDVIRRKERAHQGLRWSRVRGLLIAALLLILVFLSFTQRDVVEVWIAYLTTAAAGAAGVMKLLSMMGKPGAQRPS